jgi:branched-subunit amino acid aminotransferase/4-amino-4-deoxychorismate lyase
LLLEARVTPPVATHIWLNGRLLPSDAAHLSAYDRGFQLGDGVFEALRARRGVPIELQGHIARLHAGMAVLAMELPFGDEAVAAGISELLAAEGWDGVEPLAARVEPAESWAGPSRGPGEPGGVAYAATGAVTDAGAGGTDPAATTPPGTPIPAPGDAVIRITVSRGFDPTRGVTRHAGGIPTVAIQAWPFAPPSARVLSEGKRFVTSLIRRDAESPMAGIKTISRADLVYAHLEAERAGADDAIFLTTDGRVTEATTSNLLVIRGDECATPRLGTGLLAGTTRAWLVEHGDAVGLRMVQRDIPLAEAFAADELAVCASIGGVTPMTMLDGRAIGDGRPGPRTIVLRRARESWIDRISIEGARARLAAAHATPR